MRCGGRKHPQHIPRFITISQGVAYAYRLAQTTKQQANYTMDMGHTPLNISSKIRAGSSGFTLIEVMVSVAILAILAALAAPSFGDSIKKYRIKAIREDLMSSIQLARSEAIRRGIPVILVRTTVCSNTLIDANDWSCGWEIFVDANLNGSKSAGDLVIQTSEVPIGYGLMHTGLGSSLQVNVWGQAQGVGQKFVVTPPEGVSGSSTTTVCINSGGRIRKLIGDATCS
jgi:type IV fimbrial biogenesis protein FimT